MLKITATNLYGNTLQVTQNSLFRTVAAGLNQPTAAVFLADLATKDGSIYNSSKLNNRNVILTIWPNGYGVEAARHELYKVFKSSRYVRLDVETGSRSCWCEGYIESAESDFDSAAQEMQFSIVCPDPFLRAKTPVTAAVAAAATPVTIVNSGDFDCGAEYTITATGACTGLSITNATTGQTFGINITMAAGDSLKLTTVRGSLSLTYTASGHDPVNILNLMADGSEWPMLNPGNNSVSFNAAEGGANASMSVSFTPLYGGI